MLAMEVSEQKLFLGHGRPTWGKEPPRRYCYPGGI